MEPINHFLRQGLGHAVELTRREWLRLGLAGMGLLAFLEPLRAALLAQVKAAAGAPVYIDPHTHIFNARDIPVAGFVREVAVKSKLNFIKRLYLRIFLAPVLGRYEDEVDGAALVVDVLTKMSAPTIEEEKAKLEEFMSKNKGKSPKEQEAAFFRMANAENKALKKEMHTLVERTLTKRLEKNYDEERRERVLSFLTRLLAMRYQNAAQLVELYGGPQTTENGEVVPGVSLFAPALVDMGLWLGDDSYFPLREQTAVLSTIARLSGGRILPIIAYDPWRQAFGSAQTNGQGAKQNQPGEALQRVKEAIETFGFAGVKVYPPMGFHPLGNSRYDSDKKHWPENARGYTHFGTRLDQALRELYQWCEREEVPILTHANRSMGARRGYDKRAGPDGWETVLREFPSLRICFGHFGGWNGVKYGGDWNGKFSRLMRLYPHVYGDVGNFQAIGKEQERKEFNRSLRSRLRNFPELRERILYASDWFMQTSPGYYKDFQELIQSVDSNLAQKRNPLLRDRFFGGNAAKFLGLRKGNKARKRLDQFYNRYNMEPLWRKRLDGIGNDISSGDCAGRQECLRR